MPLPARVVATSKIGRDWPESWLGPDGHHGLHLDGIDVDRVQHRHKQLAVFGQVRFLPQIREVLQRLASFHGGINRNRRIVTLAVLGAPPTIWA